MGQRRQRNVVLTKRSCSLPFRRRRGRWLYCCVQRIQPFDRNNQSINWIQSIKPTVQQHKNEYQQNNVKAQW